MIADKDGAVLLCQHGFRRIVRIDKDRHISVLVDRFEGKRLNSPNDLVYRSDASLYFTDPPYGLLKQDDDPQKELKINGVFRLAGGKLQVVIGDLTRPNGIAFSPDEKTLYIANSDEKRKVWMKYDVKPDGSVQNGQVFFDVTAEKEEGLPDGMKLDTNGNLYCAGPGGIWVFSRGRQASGHDQAARNARQLQLGRRRQYSVYHCPNRLVSHQTSRPGPASVVRKNEARTEYLCSAELA